MLLNFFILSTTLIVGVYMQGCLDPSGSSGICKTIQECPQIRNEYLARKEDPTYLNYLRQSHANCNYVKPNICCPAEEQPPTKSPMDGCVDPSGSSGSCTRIQECPIIRNEYMIRKDDPKYLEYLRQSHANCNYVKPNICCPAEEQPTTKSTDVTRFQVEDSSSCNDPYGVPGNCKSIKECPHIRDELINRKGDAEYTNYLRQSNAACNYVKPNICCILVQPTVQQNQPGNLPTPSTGCGFSSVDHNKVVGGVPAQLGAWPWMVLLGYTNRAGEVEFRCGGSLITTRHVLTAAHCIRNNLAVARLGEHDRSTDTETQTIDIKVMRSMSHPKYDRKDGNSDLAIAYLSETVRFTDKIQPICLPISEPELSKNYQGYSPFVAGWGHTKEGGNPADVLQELQLPVLPNSECVRRYKDAGKLISPKQFDNKVLCAGILDGGKDSCQGDSGGPLMSPSTINDKDYFYQIGIVSYGLGCARANIPGVYTRVQSFIPWITERINEPI